jgi:hypothetical protein
MFPESRPFRPLWRWWPASLCSLSLSVSNRTIPLTGSFPSPDAGKAQEKQEKALTLTFRDDRLDKNRFANNTRRFYARSFYILSKFNAFILGYWNFR